MPNLIELDDFSVVMASCLTMLVPSWSRKAVIKDDGIMVLTSCLIMGVPRRKVKTLDRNIVVMASCRPCSFSVCTDQPFC